MPTAAQKLGSVPRHAPTQQAPRGEVLEWTSPQGRPYWYRLPKKNPAPALILMLHGTGGNHGWSFWNYPIGAGTFRRDDIVVSPDGVTPGGNGTFNFVQGKKDAEQIADLIKAFSAEFGVRNVYIYGHSQGAFFAYWFAGAHPELVDGIVAHAGNLLGNVAHPRLAKQKVAVAILHGQADAVVPVECAYRTHEAYEKEGYQKLKLEVVEGLTAQSGHWPLPSRVVNLFGWLDSVSADTAPLVLAAAFSELGKPAPDLEIVADCAQRAATLLGRHKGDDRDELVARSEALDGLLADAAEAHGAALSAAGADSGAKEAAAWAAHFLVVDRALGEIDEWKKPHAALASRARKDEKRVQLTLRRLEHRWDPRSFRAAADSLGRDFLAASHTVLLQDVGRRLRGTDGEAAAIPGVREEDRSALTATIAHLEKLVAEGHAAAAKVSGELAAEFRKAHPDWF